MRVLLTGGTGFVGSHTVAAALEAGHEVRLLARSAERIAPALGPLGVSVDDLVEGDVTDPEAVQAALNGVDAVIHAANVFSFRPEDRERMRSVNERGTELVLGAAAERGLDPIVHVSSYVALLPARGTVDRDSPVGDPRPAYAKSKARAELVARRHQGEGTPVVITNPGAVWGPDDPYLGESARLALSALNGWMRILNDGPIPIVDVRDVARIQAAALEPGRGPRRFLVVAASPPLRTLLRTLGEIAGRNLWSLRVPDPVALAAGRAADAAAAISGAKLPLHYEGPWLTANGGPADSEATTRELGVEFRPIEETIEDTVRWLIDAGHLKARRAPRLATAATGP